MSSAGSSSSSSLSSSSGFAAEFGGISVDDLQVYMNNIRQLNDFNEKWKLS